MHGRGLGTSAVAVCLVNGIENIDYPISPFQEMKLFQGTKMALAHPAGVIDSLQSVVYSLQLDEW